MALLTFGTLHKGAVAALAAAIGLHSADFMRVEQSRSLANNPKFRVLYNLFSRPGSRLVGRGGKGGLLAKTFSIATLRSHLNRERGPFRH